MIKCIKVIAISFLVSSPVLGQDIITDEIIDSIKSDIESLEDRIERDNYWMAIEKEDQAHHGNCNLSLYVDLISALKVYHLIKNYGYPSSLDYGSIIAYIPDLIFRHQESEVLLSCLFPVHYDAWEYGLISDEAIRGLVYIMPCKYSKILLKAERFPKDADEVRKIVEECDFYSKGLSITEDSFHIVIKKLSKENVYNRENDIILGKWVYDGGYYFLVKRNGGVFVRVGLSVCLPYLSNCKDYSAYKLIPTEIKDGTRYDYDNYAPYYYGKYFLLDKHNNLYLGNDKDGTRVLLKKIN